MTKPSYAPVFELEGDALRCPHQFFSETRAKDPVSWYEDGGFWVVTKYDIIVDVLRQPNLFSNKFQIGARADEIWQKMVRFAGEDPSLPKKVDGYGTKARRALMMTDPPENAAHRSIVLDWLVGPPVRARIPQFERTAKEFVDLLPVGEPVEFCTAFADPYSMAIIADILGLPASQRSTLTAWTKDLNAMMGNDRITDDEIREHSRGRFEFDAYFADVITDRRQNPKDDLSTAIVERNDKLDEPLSDDELLMIFQLMVVGGSDTTAAMLSKVLEELANDGELWSRLQQNSEEIENYLEGFLRLKGPVLGMFRTATEDTNLGDKVIHAGDFVWLSLVSGNYDEDSWTSFELDLSQKHTKRHLTLGQGAHHCVGAVLSRIEMAVALRAILTRFSAVDRAYRSDDEVPYRPSFLLHGPARLPLRFTAATEGSSTTAA